MRPAGVTWEREGEGEREGAEGDRERGRGRKQGEEDRGMVIRKGIEKGGRTQGAVSMWWEWRR